MLSTQMHWSIFGSHSADKILREEGDWIDLLNKIKNSGPHSAKATCPWVKLARFGEVRTSSNSLRHDENVQEIFGVEGDYDGELIPPEEAISLLEQAGVKAAIYTSPSHTEEKPRWRVIAPLSKSHPPTSRYHLLARINGVLGGILSRESFTLSQSYYFGRVGGADSYRLLVTFDDAEDGTCIDDLIELDQIAVGKPSPSTKATSTEQSGRWTSREMSDLVEDLGRKLRTGDGRHAMLVRAANSLSKTGVRSVDTVMTVLTSLVQQFFDPSDLPKDGALLSIASHAVSRDNRKDEESVEIIAPFIESLRARKPLQSDIGNPASEIDQDTGEIRRSTFQHPLTRFLAVNLKPKPPKWVIPGFIGHGVVILAGAHGVGKTTATLPLSLIVAGFHDPDDPLAPKHWRHVVYIVEDTEQAWRILAGATGQANMLAKPKWTAEEVDERIHIVEAKRLEPEYVAAVGDEYRRRFTRWVDGVEILPLVVLDTKAAVLDLENENDNAEASKAMAALKQGFAGLPTWLIGHVSKMNMGRSEAAGNTTRGASAFEADANQVLFLVKEDDGTRWLVRGKTRFEAKWTELQVQSRTITTSAEDEFGGSEEVILRWSVITPPDVDRKVVKDDAKKAAQEAFDAELRDKLLTAAKDAWASGNPLSKRALTGKVGAKTNIALAAVDRLIDECWLYEVEVPKEVRSNNSKKAFFVGLTEEQRSEFMDSGVIPEEFTEIPQSWKKPAGNTEKLSTGEIEPDSGVSHPVFPLKEKTPGNTGNTESVFPELSTVPVEGKHRGNTGKHRETPEPMEGQE